MDAMGTLRCSTSVKSPTNVPADIGPTVVARVGLNTGGMKGYAESDLEGGPLRLALGASYMADLKEGQGSLIEHRTELDLMLKLAGGSLTGAVYLSKLGEADGEVGFFAQAGY